MEGPGRLLCLVGMKLGIEVVVHKGAGGEATRKSPTSSEDTSMVSWGKIGSPFCRVAAFPPAAMGASVGLSWSGGGGGNEEVETLLWIEDFFLTLGTGFPKEEDAAVSTSGAEREKELCDCSPDCEGSWGREFLAPMNSTRSGSVSSCAWTYDVTKITHSHRSHQLVLL